MQNHAWQEESSPGQGTGTQIGPGNILSIFVHVATRAPGAARFLCLIKVPSFLVCKLGKTDSMKGCYQLETMYRHKILLVSSIVKLNH